MTFESIMAELQAGNFKPVYFLMGEEAYFIDRITGYITDNILSEEEKSFNQLILYGRDTDMNTIITSARRYPMMAPCQVSIVKEAQHLRNLDGLDSYLAAPMATTRLVFAYKYKKLDKRTKLDRMQYEQNVIMESEKQREEKIKT